MSSNEHSPLNETGNHALGGGILSKAILSDPYDVGVLLTNSTWAGLSLCRRQDGTIFGLAWAHRELTVSFIPFLLSHLHQFVLVIRVWGTVVEGPYPFAHY